MNVTPPLTKTPCVLPVPCQGGDSLRCDDARSVFAAGNVAALKWLLASGHLSGYWLPDLKVSGIHTRLGLALGN